MRISPPTGPKAAALLELKSESGLLNKKCLDWRVRGGTDNERRPKACIINPESTRPELISIYSFTLLWFVQRTRLHITSKPYPRTSAVFTVQRREKKQNIFQLRNRLVLSPAICSPKCVLQMHKKALCRCFQGVYEATVWLKQGRRASFEFNRRKTVSAASERLLNAVVCRIYGYDLLSPGLLVRSAVFTFDAAFIKYGSRRKEPPQPFKRRPLILS